MTLVKPLQIYGCKLKNEDLLMESQSGGAFTAIALYFLEKGAVVYGCGMNDDNDAVYKRITCVEDLVQIKGSKYVQVKIGNLYSLLSEDLKQGKVVLLSGTPCYVSAVKNYFNRHINYENLYTVDLICHGVPSPLVYHKYLKSLEEKKNSKIINFIFRDKKGAGWRKPVEKIMFENGQTEFNEAYSQLFYTNLTLRPSCGNCDFSSMRRCGDFTVGDYWGIEDVMPEFDDNKGVSLLFLNNEGAANMFDEFKAHLLFVESDEEKAARQPNLKGHSIIPDNREKFWNDFRRKGINYCIYFYTPVGIPFRIKRKIKHLIGKVIH